MRQHRRAGAAVGDGSRRRRRLGSARALRFGDVHAGQVVVAGNWTVVFQVAEHDLPWIRELARRDGRARLFWNDQVVFEFAPDTDGSGYFRNRGAVDEASAQRLAERIRLAQGVGGASE